MLACHMARSDLTASILRGADLVSPWADRIDPVFVDDTSALQPPGHFFCSSGELPSIAVAFPVVPSARTRSRQHLRRPGGHAVSSLESCHDSTQIPLPSRCIPLPPSFRLVCVRLPSCCSRSIDRQRSGCNSIACYVPGAGAFGPWLARPGPPVLDLLEIPVASADGT